MIVEGIIGMAASVLSVVSLIPQIYRTYQRRSAVDLSLLMILAFFFSSLCWVIYGYLIEAIWVWVTNLPMTLFAFMLLILKIKHSNRSHERADHQLP